MLGDYIRIPGDGSALTKAFKEAFGIDMVWEPIRIPLIKMSDIKPIIIGPIAEDDPYKFRFAVPQKPIDNDEFT
jgi:hypothetical protein